MKQMILRTFNTISGIKPLQLGDGPPAGAFYYNDARASVREKLNNNFTVLSDFVNTVEAGLEDTITALFGKGILSGMTLSTNGLTATVADGYFVLGRVRQFGQQSVNLPANSTTTLYVDQNGTLTTAQPSIEYITYAQLTTDASSITTIDTSVREQEGIMPAILRQLTGTSTASITEPTLAADIQIVHTTQVAVQGFIEATITSEHSGWCEVFPIYPERWTPTSFWLRVQIKEEYQTWYYDYFLGTAEPNYSTLPSNITISWQRSGLCLGTVS